MYHWFIFSCLGAGNRTNFPCSLDPETDPAVWDPAGAARNDDPRTHRGREDQVYPHADEGHDRLWRTPQRDEDEPQGHHRSPDVWPSGCGHQRLDGRDLLYSVEENSQNQEGQSVW